MECLIKNITVHRMEDNKIIVSIHEKMKMKIVYFQTHIN